MEKEVWIAIITASATLIGVAIPSLFNYFTTKNKNKIFRLNNNLISSYYNMRALYQLEIYYLEEISNLRKDLNKKPDALNSIKIEFREKLREINKMEVDYTNLARSEVRRRILDLERKLKHETLLVNETSVE